MSPTTPRLDPEDLRRYAARDWSAPERLTRRVRAALPLEVRVRIGIALYEGARATRPDWPDEATRIADLKAHQRLRRLLDEAADVGAG